MGLRENVTVPQIMVIGHNNFVFSQEGNSSAQVDLSQVGKIDRLTVQGHNNRFDNLIAKKIEIYGHNNQVTDVYCQELIDNGQNNKFRNLYKLESLPSQSASSRSN